jgi:hypothetical protein
MYCCDCGYFISDSLGVVILSLIRNKFGGAPNSINTSDLTLFGALLIKMF